MLVSFIGCPESGKTTVAALVFARLKEAGVSCEFVVEEARKYIAKKKMYESMIQLSDDDQVDIMERQLEIEEIMLGKEGDTLVVSDSSSINTLLYLSEEGRGRVEALGLLSKTENIFRSGGGGLIFYCSPTTPTNSTTKDGNRVHSYKESIRIDRSIPDVLAKHVPWVVESIEMLVEPSASARADRVVELILERLARHPL